VARGRICGPGRGERARSPRRKQSPETHIGHLLNKLGVADRVHLVIFAYEKGLIQPGAQAGDDG
jgi:hypothetical protein